MLDGVAFRWLNEPDDSTRSATELAIAAGTRTDWFVDPGTGTVKADAPALLTPEAGDYVFSALVTADLAATFDAGALVLWHDERTWAKLLIALVGDSRQFEQPDLGIGAYSRRLHSARVGPRQRLVAGRPSGLAAGVTHLPRGFAALGGCAVSPTADDRSPGLGLARASAT